jgi:polyadenylate-binding protein
VQFGQIVRYVGKVNNIDRVTHSRPVLVSCATKAVRAVASGLYPFKHRTKVSRPYSAEYFVLKPFDLATAAMRAMNGVQLGTKQLVVRLHEPKQLRQEKLAARFAGHNGHPRSASGATSPTASEGGESYAGWPSPGARSAILGSPVAHSERLERPRRGSGSYYNVGTHLPHLPLLYSHSQSQAALAGTLNLPMRYDDLSALSPVVRKEVLTGDLSRRLKSMPSIPAPEVDAIVESLVGLSLSDVVSAIQDPARLDEQIQRARNALASSAVTPPAKTPSPANSQDSRLLDPNALNATASAPEHPSTPISVAASLSTPPRTSSPSGSVAPATASERERLLAAVTRLEPARAIDLTELLMSLPKRERAMCLFNVEVLRAKLVDAKAVLDSDVPDEPAAQAIPEPVTPQSRRTISASQESTPRTPDLSSRGASAAASPTPATPGTIYTVASLARLPAAEIIKIATSPSTTGLPLPKADPKIVVATDEFIDSLSDKPIQTQKQLLGDKL